MTEPVGAQTIPATLRELATDDSEATVIVDPAGRQWTRAALDARADGVAAVLHRSHVRAGDRVAVLAGNGAGWVAAAVGAQRAGGVVLPLGPAPHPGDLAAVLAERGVRSAVVGAQVAGDLRELAEQALGPERVHVLDADARPEGAEVAGEPVVSDGLPSPDGAAVVQLTSGTTGRPKGALLSHAALLATTRDWIDCTGLGEADRYAVVAPAAHISGYKTGFLACLLSGAQMHPVERFEPVSFLELIADRAISVLQGPPRLYQQLLDAVATTPALAPRTLRPAVTGGAVVPPSLIARLRDELGISSVVTAYGLTEATGVVTMCGLEDDDRTVAGTSGRPIPSVRLRIVDEGRDVPDGEAGEVLVGGPHLMLGYDGDADATTEVLDGDGWLHTGDVGVIDAAGTLTITDRLTDMFIVNGFNVYPTEVEEVLRRYPRVRDAAVVGTPDARVGETGVAFVVTDAEVDTDALRRWCAAHLAGHKVPRHVHEVASIPVNEVGKPDKGRLRTMHAAATI